MSYRLSHLGEAAVEAAATPPHSPAKQAVALMGVAGVLWLPVLGGLWTGKKVAGSGGAWVGGLSGFVLSVAVLTSLVKKVGS